MDSTLVHSIQKFISTEQGPSAQQFVNYDSPDFLLTSALMSELVGQPVTAKQDQSKTITRFHTSDATALLDVEAGKSGEPTIRGTFAADFKAMINAIRIHEVESYALADLSPEMRASDLNRICELKGISANQLQRLTNIWIAAK